ncbi:uncharacterized protein LOC129607757 [Condylostylus longicornis]|uniref:uncharacterized protein LOC129607757 n=1 Tax=Condylostylus longicornis TaxID=2530218 RepID=UPI00244E3D24|nr:uncharacterized protein LOC129607757 [Condylostylus longicornis]
MLNKKVSRNQVLDRMHRGVVWTCIGLTLYGSYLLGLRVHRYFTVIRPAKQQKELQMIEEGKHPSSRTTIDKAPELRA